MQTTARVTACILLLAGALGVRGTARAQHDDFAVLYGEGVRAYFSGDCPRAEQYLSSALEAAAQDPRPYYFRGLSLLRQGRLAEARGDMMVGAALEAQRPGRYPVGEALIRVQGHDRLLLEKYRSQARVEAASAGTAANAPYSERESAAQRKQVVIPLEEFLRPGVPRAAVPRAAAPPPPTFAPSEESSETDRRDGDPFRDDLPPPAPSRPLVPPPPRPESLESPATEEDPFREEAEGPRPDASTTPETPAPEVEAPTADEDEDPFRDR